MPLCLTATVNLAQVERFLDREGKRQAEPFSSTTREIDIFRKGVSSLRTSMTTFLAVPQRPK